MPLFSSIENCSYWVKVWAEELRSHVEDLNAGKWCQNERGPSFVVDILTRGIGWDDSCYQTRDWVERHLPHWQWPQVVFRDGDTVAIEESEGGAVRLMHEGVEVMRWPDGLPVDSVWSYGPYLSGVKWAFEHIGEQVAPLRLALGVGR